jgi:hypothetical protein
MYETNDLAQHIENADNIGQASNRRIAGLEKEMIRELIKFLEFSIPKPNLVPVYTAMAGFAEIYVGTALSIGENVAASDILMNHAPITSAGALLMILGNKISDMVHRYRRNTQTGSVNYDK